MKRFNFLFSFTHKGERQTIPIQAESVREAKALAESLSQGLTYTGGYEIVEEQKPDYQNQQIAWICAKPIEELPFPFKQLKQIALFLTQGTDCQCCLGYRIMGAFALGGLIGYLMG